MANNAYPVYNGIEPSWADIKVTLSGSDLVLADMGDLAAINTGRSVEVGEKRGISGGRVMGTTTGQISYEFSWTFYRDGYQKFLRALMAQATAKNFKRGNQLKLSIVHFDVQIQHTPPGSDEIFDRRCRGLRVIGDTMNFAEGTDADKVEVPVHVKEIVDMIDGVECALL